MILFLISTQIHNCTHDQFMKNTHLYYAKAYSKRSLKAPTWENIRINFDYRYMDGTINDGMTCTYSGQSVSYGGYRYSCSSDDVLTPAKITAAKQTMENVRNYLQRLLKVIPNTKPIDARNFNSDTNYKLPYSVNNYDLYMGILVRPFGGTNPLAQAGSNVFEYTYNRPIGGAVFINGRSIPSSPQDENSVNNEFFYVCIHEIFHALGISSYHFNNYHPYETSNRHSQITCTMKKYGRTYNFLVTPYAHNFAVKQFGVQTFVGDDKTCPSGIEIEDGGGDGTIGSHLEGRVYMTDLMTGQTIQTESGPFNRLTDAVMSVLQDTGNYKVDWRMGQPLVWGHPESIDGNPIRDFAIGPPQQVFPEYYIWKGNQRDTLPNTGFDFKFTGSAHSFSPPSCPANNKYCNSKSFYNPNSYDVVGESDIYDFMRYIFPNNVCPRNQAAIPSTLYNYACSTYKCNGYDSFTYDLITSTSGATTKITCDRSNVNRKVDSRLYISSTSYYPRTYWYPDPERFCRTMKLYDMHFRNDPFLNYTKQLVDVPPPATPTPTPRTPTPQTPTPRTPTPKTPTPKTPTPKTPTPKLPTQVIPTPDQPTKETETKTEVEVTNKPEDSKPAIDEKESTSGEKGGDNNANSGTTKGGLSKKNWIIIGAAAGGALLLIIIIVFTVIAVKKHKAAEADSDDDILHTNFLV